MKITNYKFKMMLTLMLAMSMNGFAQFSGGDGSAGNPYMITTATELAQLATFVNGGEDDYNVKCYKLSKDIDLDVDPYNFGTGWIPIGNPTNPFKGAFDGNNQKITGLYLNDSNLNYAGLFGCIDGGSVKDLGIENVNIIGKDYVGSVAARVENNGNLSNCYSTGETYGLGTVGGVVGMINAESSISNCYSTSYVNGIGNLGGVAGQVAGSSTLSNCYATGIVIGSGSYIGGVAGSVLGGSSLSNSAALNPNVERNGTTNVGRVVGRNDGSTLTNNAAFDGILNHAGNTTWDNKGADDLDGVDMGKLAINTDGTIGGRFTTPIWTVQNGKLPGLGSAVNMPVHLRIEPTITTTMLPGGVTGTAYNAILEATGTAPITWSITSGDLPTGLTLNATTGEISGTPTTAEIFEFTVNAENSAGDDAKELSITITTAPVPPAIITTTLPVGITGTPYNVTLAVTGTAPITWSITSGNLPTGLTLNATTGEISGTPTTAEIFEFTVKAENGAGDDAKELSITIEDEVGIEQLGIMNDELRIYPNPTRGELRIEMCDMGYEICDIAIYDVMGRKVSSFEFRVSSSGAASPLGVASTLRLNISNLPAGVYFIHIQTENGMVVRKVIKN